MITNKPQLISIERIRETELGNFLEERYLQRDLHCTMYQAYQSQFEPICKGFFRYAGDLKFINCEEKEVLKSLTFQLKEEGEEHYYYFDNEWPEVKQPDTLNADDLVPSGIINLNYSGISDVQNKFGLSNLEFALKMENKDKTIIDSIGYFDLPFNKSVKRIRRTNQSGISPEVYNSNTKNWQEIEDLTYVPSYFESRMTVFQ